MSPLATCVYLIKLIFIQLAVLLITASTCAAQSDDSIGLFAVDLRGSFTPSKQSEQLIPENRIEPYVTPGQNFGIQAGAHFYPLQWNVITFGVGANFHLSMGDQALRDNTLIIPTVRKNFTAISPQISLNFGKRNGWSYLSSGIGISWFPISTIINTTRSTKHAKTLNYGGGARWFMKEHLAFSLDIRFYAISPRAPSNIELGFPRMTIMVVSIGTSFK